MTRRVMVVAVHPDDETLGCGGALLRHIQAGDEVHWLLVTAMSEEGGFSAGQVARRRHVAARVAEAYPFAAVHELGLPPTKVDQCPPGDLVPALAQVFRQEGPHVLYLPFLHDAHSDHRAVFAAAYSCTKSFRLPALRKILMMETPSETEFAPAIPGRAFTPNVFVDISPFLERKLEIMKLYDTELGPPPFPRSLENVEALSVFRGASSGFMHAEAFMLLRERVD